MGETFDTLPFKGSQSPLRFDRNGIVHAVEGADVHPGIRLLWAKCGCADVPANTAWYGSDPVTCAQCDMEA